MDIDDVARIATGLEGVRARTRQGRRGWYLDGRLVARAEDDNTLVVRSDFGARERLVEEHPEIFTVTPQLEAHMKVLLDLDAATHEVLTDALEAAAELQRSATAS